MKLIHYFFVIPILLFCIFFIKSNKGHVGKPVDGGFKDFSNYEYASYFLIGKDTAFIFYWTEGAGKMWAENKGGSGGSGGDYSFYGKRFLDTGQTFFWEAKCEDFDKGRINFNGNEYQLEEGNVFVLYVNEQGRIQEKRVKQNIYDPEVAFKEKTYRDVLDQIQGTGIEK